MKIISLIILTCTLFFITPATAQEGAAEPMVASPVGYKYGIGLRGGALSGINGKMMIAPQDGIEVIIGGGWRYSGVLLVGLYERHVAVATAIEGLNWFYGGGFHTGLYDHTTFNSLNKDVKFRTHDYVVLGVDGVLGIEYFIGEIPFTLGVDIHPVFDLVPKPDFFFGGAISVRYVWGQP